jgi:ABC-2 type transport system permease protein
MTRIVSSELFKLRTTRTFYAIVAAALAIVVLISVAAALATKFGGHSSDSDNVPSDLLGIGNFAQIFALILGILAVTTEFRHGTITPSLLAVPDRARLTLGKFGASLLVGLGLGILSVGLSTALVLGLLAARDITTHIPSSEVLYSLLGGILAIVLYAGIGVGVGAIVRNQVGAIVGALVWLFVLESLLGIIPTVGDWIGEYGPGGAANALGDSTSDRGSHTLDQLPGGILLAGYCLVFLLVGIHLMRRRDVSA